MRAGRRKRLLNPSQVKGLPIAEPPNGCRDVPQAQCSGCVDHKRELVADDLAYLADECEIPLSILSKH